MCRYRPIPPYPFNFLTFDITLSWRAVYVGFVVAKVALSQHQWPRSLRLRSVAACLLRLWVWIPPGWHGCLSWVLSGRGLCDELITHPDESYRLWCVIVCDLETSWMRRPWPTVGAVAPKKNVALRYIFSPHSGFPLSFTVSPMLHMHVG